MARISRIAAGVLAGMLVLVVGIGIAWGGAGPSGSESRLELNGVFVHGKSIDVNDDGYSRGDYDLFMETLTSGNREVGTDRGICWVHVGGSFCEVVFRIDGRGTLTGQAFVPNKAEVATGVVTGGTGDFDGAGGMVRIEFGRELHFSFNLIFPARSEFA